MKIKTFIFISFLIMQLIAFSQDNNDSIKLAERNTSFISYDNYRSSITDTTTEVLKKLVTLQTDLIITDNAIIHNYISTNTQKVNELQKKIQKANDESSLLKKNYEEGKKYVFYGLIGAGILVLLTILFFTLYVLANNKKKKIYSQLKKIEIIKDEQFKEINILKKEKENQISNTNSEVNKEKENLENELKTYKAKVDLLLKEKNDTENKYKEKEKAFNELSAKQNTLSTEQKTLSIELKNDYENKIALLNNEIAQLKQELMMNQQKEISLEENTKDIQSSEEKDLLKIELNQCKQKLENENNLRIEIENEIKQLIEEIKEIRKQ